MGRPDGPPKGGHYQPPIYQRPPEPQNYESHNQHEQQQAHRNMDPTQTSFPPNSVLHPGNSYVPGEERPAQPNVQGAHAVDSPDSGTDSTDGGYYRSHVYQSSHYYQRSVSTVDEVTQQTPDYLTSFLIDRMHRDGVSVPPGLAAQRRGVNTEVARCLQRIGDELTSNTHLNNLIGQVHVTPGSAFDTFASVASQIFEDGIVNWGRVVTLFYFAYRLALQCVTEIKFIQTIIDWVCKFIAGRIARWISDRGGWTAIKEYFGSTSAQMVGVFLVGCIVTALIFRLNKS